MSDGSADIVRYLRLLMRRSWIVALVAVLTVVVVMAVQLTAAPKYQATAVLAFTKSDVDAVIFGSQLFTDSDPDKAITAAAALIKLESFSDEIRARLGLAMPASQLMSEISTSTSTEADTVTVVVTDSDRQRVARIANAIAAQYIADRNDLERGKARVAAETVKRELDSLSKADSASEFASELRGKYQALLLIQNEPVSGFSVLSSAEVPAGSTTQTARTGALALVVGLVLGVVLVLLLEYVASLRVEGAESVDKE